MGTQRLSSLHITFIDIIIRKIDQRGLTKKSLMSDSLVNPFVIAQSICESKMAVAMC